jgi:hypothetical protein
MQNPRENQLEVESLLERVKNHPMCLKLHPEGHCFVVIYPDGELPSDGIRISKVSKYGGQAVNLMILLLHLEKVWLDTTPGFKSLPKYDVICDGLKNKDTVDKKELKAYLKMKLEEVGI